MIDTEIFNEGAFKADLGAADPKKAHHKERPRARKNEKVVDSSDGESNYGFDSDPDCDNPDRMMPDDDFLIIGLSKGSVIFVKVRDIE